MAKDTRAQRRARREARDPSGVLPPTEPAVPNGPPPKAPPPAQVGADGPGRESKAPVSKAPGHVPGSGVIGFIKESAAELKKVEWPTQAQVVTGTTVVLIACIIVGVFLYVNDEVWKRVVENIVLK